ncbi:HK97 family phage prohead protease [Stenotrophomonas sp. PSU-St15]
MNRKSAALKIRDFDLSVKAVSDGGLFSGYGSVFGTVDSYREVVAPGAFSESLAEIKSKGRPVPVLWQHRSGEPIGVYTGLVEDAHGLKVEGQLIIDGVARAKEAHALMKAGAVSGLSIGYYVREDSWDEKERVRTLKKVDLVEISLVTFPANDDARIDAIKSKLAHGSLPTMPEFEQILREAGFSKSQSAVIANRGLKHLLDRSESGSKATEDYTAVPVLGRLTLPTF